MKEKDERRQTVAERGEGSENQANHKQEVIKNVHSKKKLFYYFYKEWADVSFLESLQKEATKISRKIVMAYMSKSKIFHDHLAIIPSLFSENVIQQQ